MYLLIKHFDKKRSPRDDIANVQDLQTHNLPLTTQL